MQTCMFMNATESKGATPRSSALQAPRSYTASAPARRERSSVYRGATREAAEAAYHLDARIMALMGFAPTSEDWSVVREEVLTVAYLFDPERAPAVLKALKQAEAERAVATLAPAPVQPNGLKRAANVLRTLPPAVKLTSGGLGGIAVAVAVCVLLGLISGDSPDTVSLVGFGIIGLFIGAFLGLPGD
jgi:hypothetical protein